jgi:ABC-type sugar transport system substrate-binding protein
MGILQAIKEAKRTDIKIVSGGGGTQTYFNTIGKSSMSLFTATYSPSMIKEAVQDAYDIVHGKQVPKDKIVAPSIVDKANYKKFLDAGSPY